MTDIASLGIVVKTQGVRQSEAELRALSKEADRAEAKASMLGKAWGIALGAGAAAVIVGGVKAIIRETVEAEKVQTRLENRVRALGGTSAASVKQIDALATALQGVSTFDDEKLKSAATSLLAFNNIKADNFERALRAATDLAADSGDDLVATTEKLGKALNNPLTAARLLRTVGIELSASQKALVKDLTETGRASEAQAILLGELEKRYGGAAAAARNTLGGAVQGLKNDFDNLLEGDGKGVKGATQAINELAATMRSPGVQQGFQTIVTGLFDIINASVKAIAKLAEVGSAISEFFAENEKKSTTALQNKREGLESDLFAVKRGTFSAAKQAYFGNDNVSLLETPEQNAKRIQKEIDRIDAELKRRNQQGMFSGVSGSVSGPGLGAKPSGGGGGGGGGGGSSGGGSRGVSARLSDLPDFSKNATDDLRQMVDEENRATEAYRDLAATLAGPLAEAQRDHEKRVAQINELAKQSTEASAGRDALLDAEADRYKKETDAIQAQLSPYQELMAEKENDLRLMGLIGVERDLEIDRQRLGRQLTEEETKALREKNAALEQAAKTAEVQRVAQNALSDSIFDFVTGAKSAKDAARDFFDTVAKAITRMIADQWAEKIAGLFSASGGSGTSSVMNPVTGSMVSSGGSGWSAAIGAGIAALFGGGRASGGPVSGNRFYEVGEHDKPEILQMHGRSFLIPGNDGTIKPASQSGDNSVVVNQVINVQGQVDQRTRNQLRADSASNQNRALARNR